MRDHLDAFARHLAAGHAAPRTVRTYGAVLSSLAETLPAPGGPPTRAQVEAFLGRRRQDGTPRAASTRNQELAAIRAFTTFARDGLGWAEDPARGVTFVREPPRAPTVLSGQELSALFGTAARASRSPARDLALLAALSQAALRVHEAEALLQRLRAPMGTSKRVTPHTLRHTAATLTLTAGTDLATVGELLRHSDLNTTRRYLHLVDTRRREAVRRLEGTVPVEVLPAPEASARVEEKVGLGETPEAPGSCRNQDLDDQCGLVAHSAPTIRPSPATNASAPPDGGAFPLGGAGEGGPDLRGGPMFRLIPLVLLSLALALAACGTPVSAPADAATGADVTVDTGAAADADADAATGADATAVPDAAAGTDITMATDAMGADAPPADGAGADAPRPDAGLRPSAVARLPCTADSECDDGIPCTLDACDLGTRCMHLARPAMCDAGETCDIRMGCRPGRACATDADCADEGTTCSPR